MKNHIFKKGINNLYHFTNVENLKSIIQNGIIPRATLINEGIKSCYNDNNRYDNCLDAVCMSIEFPNYRMFYKIRCANPTAKWVVLGVNPSVLYECKCAFCWTNASDSSMYHQTIAARSGEDAFLRLFEDSVGYPSRKNLDIPPQYPTNPQAEVLVFENVSSGYIKDVIFNDTITAEKYRYSVPEEVDIKIDESKFGPRRDYLHWKKG